MPTQHKLDSGQRLLSWASDLDYDTMNQATNMARMPFVTPHASLMADAHLGYGVPIGAVIPTLGAIMPAAVGVDIGCGMIAVETSLQSYQLPDTLELLLSDIEASIPAGLGQGHESFTVHKDLHRLGSWRAPLEDKKHTAARQLGTLGSGNHFVELCLDAEDHIWVVLHSGSRGIGNKLARHHIDKAKGLMKAMFISLPDPDLAYFVERTPEFEEYIHDLRWAQNYALLNRERMMDAALVALAAAVRPQDVDEIFRVNCHHNYTEQENHFGKNVWVTRKGAIRAREGDYGVIPGSMGTNSYIVKGLGNKASFNSAAHGAGRKMSRSKARKTLSLESFAKAMEGRTWLDTKATALLDEHPDAYKDIEQVMRNQADLVTVEAELHAILNYKGA
jgi:tRNA-splicing ligase RtcB